MAYQKYFGEGHINVLHHSLVEYSRNLLPTLLNKLGHMKNFLKTMDRNVAAFLYLRQNFPLISDAKIREGVFNGPDIRLLLR